MEDKFEKYCKPICAWCGITRLEMTRERFASQGNCCTKCGGKAQTQVDKNRAINKKKIEKERWIKERQKK